MPKQKIKAIFLTSTNLQIIFDGAVLKKQLELNLVLVPLLS